MKVFLVLVLYVAFSVLASCDGDGKEKFSKKQRKVFSKHCKQHGIRFKSLAEELAAMEILLAIAKEVDEHNKAYDAGTVSYKRNLNRHSHKSPAEIANLFGGSPSDEDEKKSRGKRETYPTYAKPPASVDWTKSGLVGPVENQGGCGACWSFSSTGVINAAWRKKNVTRKLASNQQLVDCAQFTKGCDGAYPPNAMNYAIANGMTDEEEYPYVEYKSSCEYSSDTKVAGISKYYAVPTRGNETWMKEVAGNVGPIGIFLCASDPSFQTLADGVYDNPDCCTGINHTPLITGYGTDKKHGDYWIVKNSWGTTWGVGGYGKVARGKNMCGIGYYALYAEV